MIRPRGLRARSLAIGLLPGGLACALALGLLCAGDAAAQKKPARQAANQARQQAQQQGANANPRGAVFMLDADRFDGPVLALKDGELSIDSDPPRHVPLDEVDRIDLGSAGSVMVVWVGQDNHDGTGPATTQAANGIQDIHLECRGLALGRTLQQVVISGAPGGEVHVWMLNLNNAPFWKLENIRPQNSTTTNWYLEPPATDCFDQSFDVVLTFNDNTTVKTKVKATTHTNAKLKFDKEQTEATAKPAENGSLVILANDETVRGRSLEIADETLIVQPTTGGELQIPLAEVRGIWLGGSNAPQQRKRFDERLKKPGQSDWVMIRAKDADKDKEGDKEGKPDEAGGKKDGDQANPAAAKANDDKNNNRRNNRRGKPGSDPEADKAADRQVAGVEGSVQQIALNKLSLVVGQETRKVALGRVVGIVMAAHAAALQQETFHQVFELANGEKMSGQLIAIKEESLDIHTRYGDDMHLPRGEVTSITCRGGKATYLSDLEPASVEEVSYFDRPLGYHRDQNLTGGPLAVRGTTYRKGLAVHSRCVLTYALDGHYELFRARLGFEDGAPVAGSIACRVLADDRELFNNSTFRADAEPVSLKLDLTGAKQLVLEVDFGEMQNVGDRVVWGAARVVRPADGGSQPAAPPAASASASAGTSTASAGTSTASAGTSTASTAAPAEPAATVAAAPAAEAGASAEEDGETIFSIAR